MIFPTITKNKRLLPLWVTLGIGVIIVLGHIGAFPFSVIWGVVISLALSVLAFFHPRIMFGVFFASIVFERIPVFVIEGMDFRWYQIEAVSLAVGLLLRWISGKENIRNFLSSLGWIDLVIGGIFVSSSISALINKGFSVQQTLVLGSFIFIYFLVRFGIRGKEDILRYFPFLTGSFFIVAIYGIVQNILFLGGWVSGEVMLGRPNATFAEADWLGIYVGVGVIFSAISIFLSIITPPRNFLMKGISYILSYEIFLLGGIVLLLTMARSAWLATILGLLAVGGVLLWKRGFRVTLHWGKNIALAGIFVLGIVLVSRLTPFELGNRVQSIGTGLQEITIACVKGYDKERIPRVIDNKEELDLYGCQHINLEEIESYSYNGYEIQKVFRKDPSTGVRKNIWSTALEIIQKNIFWGIGWGNIGTYLGTDDYGVTLNSSNIFLEFWLGSGVIGVVFFGFLFGYILTGLLRKLALDDIENQSVVLGLFGVGVVILISNMFNSGHFLAIFWVWMAFAVSILNENRYGVRRNSRE